MGEDRKPLPFILIRPMENIERLSEKQRMILSDFLEKKIGPFRHAKDYYHEVITELANGFYSGLFSSDDVSVISEEIFIKSNEYSKSAMQELPDPFFMLMELEWDIRNNPERAVQTLLNLKKFIAK